MTIHPRLKTIFEQASHTEIVYLALGELFSLSEEQLKIQWNELAQMAQISNSQLNIRKIPAEHQCMVCFQKYHPENLQTVCPHCGSVGAKVIAGEELYLESKL
jgi:Zn finger protein HypA/HybF involved in hydrogenase expression